MASSKPIRKVLISGAGDISVLSVIDATIDPPKAGEVQVRPLYSGFSGADINMREGVYPMQKKAPLTPGYSLVGTVVALGLGTSNSSATGGRPLQPGQLVASLTVYDAQAQLVNLPEKYLIPVPDAVDPQSATAVMLDWTTALGLVEHAKVRAGQRVFVHGMSGAVGWALLTLCRLRGAAVYGTASASKHDLIRKEGGTSFVYTDKRWMQAMRELGGAHVVFDALGFESWGESYDILKRKTSPAAPVKGGDSSPSAGLESGGLLVGYGGNLHNLTKPTPTPQEDGKSKGSAAAATPAQSQVSGIVKLLALNAKLWDSRSTSFWYISRDDKSFRPNVEKLFAMLAAGELKIPIKQVWDMEDIRQAHTSWGKGDGVGSILIKVNDE
ncbi:chaperonin 10-like protein [Microdochium trichocladiopsis]|uniref:Chaperonin 10-like protein n=1 Tax=Microdochium trichocladiopsis TaxID=1682393 RepID=A0A9P8XX56_9PEZI|nr:chaperonin 10-like protein [Microdochium trichocladiopsis]KAH7021002.1 chaperonin 10-like protein [Microdochium trichocladiopsis]